MSRPDAKTPSALVKFVTRWEMTFHATTVALYIVSLSLVIVLFPDVSNLWVSIFVLVGSCTAAVAGMIAAIKSRGEQ